MPTCQGRYAPPEAVTLLLPQARTILKYALFYHGTGHLQKILNIAVLLFACCVYIKKTYLGGVAFSRVDWMIGLVIALLFFPVHELIHAVSFPAGSEVIMFYTTQGLGTTCTSPMTRNRFIVINMLPSLILGVVPLIAYMIVPRTYAFASTVLCVFSLVHVGTGYVDYLNIVHLLRLPADSKIQISGAKIYWM